MKNLRQLGYKFELNQSQHKSGIASPRPNETQVELKSKTLILLASDAKLNLKCCSPF